MQAKLYLIEYALLS